LSQFFNELCHILVLLRGHLANQNISRSFAPTVARESGVCCLSFDNSYIRSVANCPACLPWAGPLPENSVAKPRSPNHNQGHGRAQTRTRAAWGQNCSATQNQQLGAHCRRPGPRPKPGTPNTARHSTRTRAETARTRTRTRVKPAVPQAAALMLIDTVQSKAAHPAAICTDKGGTDPSCVLLQLRKTTLLLLLLSRVQEVGCHQQLQRQLRCDLELRDIACRPVLGVCLRVRTEREREGKEGQKRGPLQTGGASALRQSHWPGVLQPA
jgi:hypothetical protein